MKNYLDEVSKIQQYSKRLKALRWAMLMEGNQQFAEAAETTPNAVAQWIRGNSRPQPQHLKRMSDNLKIPLEFLMFGEVGEVPQPIKGRLVPILDHLGVLYRQ